jgi:two-component system, OmpR family, sensor histidine kinase SenX3
MLASRRAWSSIDETTLTAVQSFQRVSDVAATNAAESANLKDALDALPHAVVLVGSPADDGWRNRAARLLLGSGRVEALLDAAIANQRSIALAGGTGSQGVEVVGPPNRTYALTSVPLQTVGGQRSGVVTVTDLTDMTRLERVRREFVANVSHELRTPVGAMAVLAETLQDEDDLAVVNRLSAKISEAHRLSRTVTDLLELSVLESSGQAARRSYSVTSLVSEAVARAESSAESLGVVIDISGVDSLHTVLGDFGQLTSAIGNLLENAVKYSDPGGSVAVTSALHDGMVTIAVADNGVGIPARDLDRVFERFYRVDTARSRATGGTGLGLAIVRHVAENHGGQVSVESIEGKGTTFRLLVPAAATQSGEGNT